MIWSRDQQMFDLMSFNVNVTSILFVSVIVTLVLNWSFEFGESIL